MTEIVKDHQYIVQLVKNRFEIPTIPAIATRVAQEIQDPNTTAARLARLIANDQGLTTRILSVANSPFYGIGRKMSSVQQAVVTLGFEAVQGLVVCFSTRKVYKSFGAIEKSLWEHAMAAAIAADLLAKAKSLKCKKDAFVAGLMHDVGKVVLNNEAPDVFKKTLQKALALGQESIEAEQDLFSLNHGDVGMVLTEQWGLSDSLVQSVFLHHDLDLAESTAGEHLELIYVIHLADQISRRIGIGTPITNPIDYSEDLAAIFLGFEPTEIDTLSEEAQKAYEKERTLFL